MAKVKSTGSVASFRAKPKSKRRGIHAKTKMSKNKNSKTYFKVAVGQG